jgi:hypothetical protein
MHTQMQKTELTCAEYIQSNICSAVDPWFPEAQFLDVVDAQCHQPQGAPGGWNPGVAYCWQYSRTKEWGFEP